MNQAEIEETVWLTVMRLCFNSRCIRQALTIESLDSRQGEKPGSRPNDGTLFVQTILHEQSFKHCLNSVIDQGPD